MWAQVINAVLGIWLMVAPGVFGFPKTIADNDHIIGPVIATFAVIAFWDCTRVVRTYNIPLGVWLLVAPWVLGYEVTGAIVNDMLVGGLIVLFSFVKGNVEGRFGGGWSAIWKSDTLHQKEANAGR